MTKSANPLQKFLDAGLVSTLGNLPHEATCATLEDGSQCADMPPLDEALRIFSDVRATLVLVPVRDIAKAIMEIPELAADHGSFDAYHRWYMQIGDMPTYGRDRRWPCIASSDPDELIWDGWHRMHAYIAAGDDTVPVLRYDTQAWWMAHERWQNRAHPKPRGMAR